MMAQDPLRDPLAWFDAEWVQAYYDKQKQEWIRWDDLTPQQREDVNRGKLDRAQASPYALYQWGVWVTSNARAELVRGIRTCTVRDRKGVKAECIYVDTDSCKYIGDVDWTVYNSQKIADSQASGAYAKDAKGNIHYMGVFESELGYRFFKTLGAKKYAYIHDGRWEVETTIAGVSKSKGGTELKAAARMQAKKARQKMKPGEALDLFTEGFIFILAGGLEAVYNDSTPVEAVYKDGHRIEMGPNICLKPSTYTVSLKEEYREILKKISFMED